MSMLLRKQGRVWEALHFLHSSEQPVQSSLYISLLQTSVNGKDISSGKFVHAHIIENGFMPDKFLWNTLLNFYAKAGRLPEARKVFDQMPSRDSFTWTIIISAYLKHGLPEKGLALYHQMQRTGVQPDEFTFASVVPALTKLADLKECMAVHGQIIRSGLMSDGFVASALLDMYSKRGRIKDARKVFDEMPQRDVVLWNVMIAGCAQNGDINEAIWFFRRMPERNVASWNSIIVCCAKDGDLDLVTGLYNEMRGAGIQPNCFTFTSVIPLVGLQQGMEIHEDVVRSGCRSDVFVANALVDMYAKCGAIEEARLVFDKMPQRDAVSWNAIIGGYAQNGLVHEAAILFREMPERNVASWNTMIAGYARNGLSEEALMFFYEMQRNSIKANKFTFASVLAVCARLEALEQGIRIHDEIIRCGCESDMFVRNAMVDFYAKCGRIEKARDVFDIMPQRDVVSWNAMIAGYVHNGHGDKALEIFQEMQLSGMKPDLHTLSCVLSASTSLAGLEHGMEIHEEIIRRGYHGNVSVANALVNMYAKCGSIAKAFDVFKAMPHRNSISWTAMIAGYAENGKGMEALKLFQQMKMAGVDPDPKAFVSVLPACANLGAFQQGKEIHGNTIRSGLHLDVFVVSALVDMYAKCGNLEKARNLFDNMPQRNVVSWTTMIAGYAMHGFSKEAIQLFEEMCHSGLKPNDVTFVCLLSACCHSGLVDDGWRYFNSMTKYYQIKPSLDHYGCMVDLLARAGRLDEAHNFINKLPITPDATMWGSLLGACRSYNNIQLGEHVAEHIFKLDIREASPYVLLSNVYAIGERWDGIEKVRNMMKDRRVQKIPGCSWIEVSKEVHAFLSEDNQNYFKDGRLPCLRKMVVYAHI